MQNENARTSPYAQHRDSKIVYDKKKKLTVITKLNKYLLKQQEIAVIDALNRYTVLNAHMIGVILSRNMGYPSDAIKTLLAKLTKTGLVERFRIAYPDAYGTEHRTPYIYMVADEALRTKTIRMECETILSCLAFNQFYIHMSHIYQPSLDDICYTREIEAVDGTIKFHSQKKAVRMDIVAIRQYSDLIERLSAVEECEFTSENLLIVCENELHALEIERVRNGIKNRKPRNVFYMTDATTAAEELPMTQLIHVKNEREYEIVSVPVDGTTRGRYEINEALN